MTIPKLLFASKEGMRAVPAVLSKDYKIGDTTIECNDLSSWPEYVSFILYEVNANGVANAEVEHLDCLGKVVGNTITELKITAGKDRGFSRNLTRLVVDETAEARNRLIQAVLSVVNADGSPVNKLKVENGQLNVEHSNGEHFATNTFSDKYKTKLDSIEERAQANVLENIKTSDGESINISEKSVVLPDFALKTEIASVYRVKGSLANLEAIQAVDIKKRGDVYNAEDTGMNYVWTGNEWDAIGSTVDLTDYVTNAKLQEALAGLGSNGSSGELSNAVSDLRNEINAAANKLNEIIGAL